MSNIHIIEENNSLVTVHIQAQHLMRGGKRNPEAIMTMSLTYSSFDIDRQVRRSQRALWSASLLAAALAVFAVVELAGIWGAQTPLPGAPLDARKAGRFTGSFVDGVPVYRLPPITVVAERNALIAGSPRDDGAARGGSRTEAAPKVMRPGRLAGPLPASGG